MGNKNKLEIRMALSKKKIEIRMETIILSKKRKNGDNHNYSWGASRGGDTHLYIQSIIASYMKVH